ncbi:MAG: helix-turn-helix transcriptional regulator [Betaproteobacteria bacterium]|nr:helix-turn-helix transcriptional regulator [Betaproteobacteria bacterium]
MDDDQLDLVFHALASQPRREILAAVRGAPGCNVNFISELFDMSRIGVMKHLAVLEAANLIVSEKVGRERQMYFNPVPIQQIHEMWTDEFTRHFSASLTKLKRIIEQGEDK